MKRSATMFASAVHATAVKGFSAEAAALYNAGRPTYSNDALDRVFEVLYSRFPERENSTIVELGAGTGKFTSAFLSYSKSKSVLDSYPAVQRMKYIATEPSDGFRASLKEILSAEHANVEIGSATGSSIPQPDKSVDGVVVAQAFHWMATTDTLKEVHRVLAPQSPLVLVWNTYDYSFDWLRQIDAQVLSKAYAPDVPRQQNGKWQDCFNTDTGRDLFSMVHKWQGRYVQAGDADMIVGRVMSTSVVVEKTPQEKVEIEKIVRNIIATHPELEEARKTKRFEISYITELAWVNSNISPASGHNFDTGAFAR